MGIYSTNYKAVMVSDDNHTYTILSNLIKEVTYSGHSEVVKYIPGKVYNPIAVFKNKTQVNQLLKAKGIEVEWNKPTKGDNVELVKYSMLTQKPMS
jgi:hypothetical protein